MTRKIKKFSDFLTEAAEWDDTSKRQIDKFFVSFDSKENYEVRDFIHVVLITLAKYGITLDANELSKVVISCKDKIAHNNPRKALFKCVLANYGIDIEDID